MNQSARGFSVVLLFLISVMGCGEDPAAISNPKFSHTVDSSFTVGELCTLTVDNFVGGVIVRPGVAGVVRVLATRWARSEGGLQLIEVEMIEVQNCFSVTTSKPSGLSEVSVDLEITAPADIRPIVRNGVGSTSYEGRAEGESHFETGVGSVELILATDINVEVQLAVGVGSISVEFPVDGQVSQNAVNGIIGTGLEGKIHAQVGVGSIRLTRQ